MTAYCRYFPCFLFVVFLLLLIVGLAPASYAQQPTVVIEAFEGTVLVAFQGQNPQPATIGDVLQAGDIIETNADSRVELGLSEGSQLKLGPKTKIDIAVLEQRPATNARQSRIKLLYGRLRAFLAPGHQKDGSTFTVETPNAAAGVKFSHPELDVLYDPGTKTTIVKTYTVEVSVVNLVSKAEITAIPKGHQAVIKGSFILVTRITELSGILNDIDTMAQERAALGVLEDESIESGDPARSAEESQELLVDTWYNIGTNDPATSQIPGPAAPPDSTTTGAEPVDTSITITVK